MDETPDRSAAAALPRASGSHAVLRQPTRAALYRIIHSDWGLCEADLGRLLGVGRSNVKYHLHRLVRAKLVQTWPQGRKVHYFPRGAQPPELHRAVSSAQNGTRRQILRFLRDQPEMSWRAISRAIGVTPRAVRWHIQSMADLGLLRVERDGLYRRATVSAALSAVLDAGDEASADADGVALPSPSAFLRAARTMPAELRVEARDF